MCKIERSAAGCGLTVSEYLRRRALGYTPKFHPPPELFSALTYMDNLTDMLERLDPVSRGHSTGCVPKRSATVCFVEVKTVSELAPVHWIFALCMSEILMYELRIQITSEPRRRSKKSMPEIPGDKCNPFAGGRSGSDATENRKTSFSLTPHTP